MDLTIYLIQTSLFWEDIDANLGMLEEKIWQIGSKVDLIVLPEMFTTGFTVNAKPLAEPMNGKTFKWMKQQAKQTDAAMVGSYVIYENGNYYNRLIWMQPDGKYFSYDKRHTFKLTGEHEVFAYGKAKLVINWRGWNICPLICYDLRFPIWSRNTIIDNNYEYDVLVYVANWPQSRNAAWEALLKARAVENSCYCVGLNIVGTDGRGFSYIGNSGVYNPLVKNLMKEDQGELLSKVVLSKLQLDDYRKKYPFLNDADQFKMEL